MITYIKNLFNKLFNNKLPEVRVQDVTCYGITTPKSKRHKIKIMRAKRKANKKQV